MLRPRRRQPSGGSLFDENRTESQGDRCGGPRWCQGRAKVRQVIAQNAQSAAKVAKKALSDSSWADFVQILPTFRKHAQAWLDCRSGTLLAGHFGDDFYPKVHAKPPESRILKRSARRHPNRPNLVRAWSPNKPQMPPWGIRKSIKSILGSTWVSKSCCKRLQGHPLS